MVPKRLKTLCRLSIPPRLKSDMMFKEAFDVPNDPAGAHFLTWWDGATAESRDNVMKLAYDKDIPVTEALVQLAHAPFEDAE